MGRTVVSKITMAHLSCIRLIYRFKDIRNILWDRNVLKSSVLGSVILVVRCLAFTDIHLRRLAIVFARRHAASPSMGRTVVSPITMAHLSCIRVICRFKRHTQHTFGQKSFSA